MSTYVVRSVEWHAGKDRAVTFEIEGAYIMIAGANNNSTLSVVNEDNNVVALFSNWDGAWLKEALIGEPQVSQDPEPDPTPVVTPDATSARSDARA